MRNPRLATRYAKALLDFSIEKKQEDVALADIKWLDAVCTSNKDFLNLLKSPIIKAETKNKIVKQVATGNISELTLSFLTLLITKGREISLKEICGAFITQYNTLKNIHVATLTTASIISDKVKQAIVNKVKQVSGQDNIQLIEKINPALIGGFVLELGDKMIDASIAHDLHVVAQQFKKNDFIYNIR